MTAKFNKKESSKVYYVAPLNDSNYGIFINNRRVTSNAENEVQLSDIVVLERPGSSTCKWYINSQYLGVGSTVSFTVGDFLYSASNYRFLISWQ